MVLMNDLKQERAETANQAYQACPQPDGTLKDVGDTSTCSDNLATNPPLQRQSPKQLTKAPENGRQSQQSSHGLHPPMEIAENSSVNGIPTGHAQRSDALNEESDRWETQSEEEKRSPKLKESCSRSSYATKELLYVTNPVACNHCDSSITQAEYYHCCHCEDNFDMCLKCYEAGKSCNDTTGTHPKLSRLMESRPSLEEYQCKPENWAELFEYRLKDRKWGEHKVVTAANFAWKESKTDNGMILERVQGSKDVQVALTSKHLRALVRSIDAYDRLGVKVHSRTMDFSSPYEFFFHHLDDLRKRQEEQPDVTALDKAQRLALHRYFTEGPPSTEFQDIRQDLSNGVIKFSQVWALFKPGVLVFQQTMGHPEILRVHRCDAVTNINGDVTAWDVIVVQIVWDGRKEKFQPSLMTVRVEAFNMSRKITSLRLVPLNYLGESDRKELVEKVIKRGEKWVGYCRGKPITKFYKGPAIPYVVTRQFNLPWAEPPQPEEEFLSCRIIVDPGLVAKAKRYANLHTKHLTDQVVSNGQGENDPKDPLRSMWDLLGARRSANEKLQSQADPDYLLCPSTIPVFALEEQEYMIVCVDSISDADWSPDAFQRLVLSKEKKNHLQRLANAHSEYKDRRSNDVIKGKGKGLVMLFYGPPGVGKTLTAEALSEETRLPLYRVNLGVVSSSKNWEPHLDHIFACAYSWNAILLIDEAEVVLEERSFKGKDQNTWVSVFLRKLEYYQGILILTTNMIHQIDEAFRSRISVAHEYLPLDENARREVWNGIISRMGDKKVLKEELHKRVGKWAEKDFNARQIRNILMTAETAVFDEVGGLDVETVEIFIREAESFINLFKKKAESNRRKVLD